MLVAASCPHIGRRGRFVPPRTGDPGINRSVDPGRSRCAYTERTVNPPLSHHVPWVARWGVHLLVAGLLALAVGRARFVTADAAGAVLAAAVVTGVVYAAGPLTPAVTRSHRAAAGWLVLLSATWVALLVTTADGVWLAFPLFFLQLHLLSRSAGAAAVVASTLVAVAGFSWHRGELAVAFVVGPFLGAAFAVVTVWGYQALYAENERRRTLIEELTATRSELAAAEHSAGVLAERERLATEIHDTVAQGLSSIQLLLRAAQRTVTTDPAAAWDQVDQARRAAQTNLTEARRLVRAWTPLELEEGSLLGALRGLCETTAAQHGIAARLQCIESEVSLPSPVEVTLLRITQSALANVVQHADADRVEVTLSLLGDDVVLDVVDDGRGFAADTLVEPGPGDATGFGLPAMRARARAHGGTMVVESRPGEGTALAVTIPEVSRWSRHE